DYHTWISSYYQRAGVFTENDGVPMFWKRLFLIQFPCLILKLKKDGSRGTGVFVSAYQRFQNQ
ncbi:hypothetical protein IRJ41_011512, partial [Triplophysa rosa]